MILLILGLAFIVLTVVGLPISFAVGVATVLAHFLLPGVDNATIVQRMLTSVNTFPLLAVIFFVFAGVLMARGGIARRLVMMAEVLVGWLPGSLAQIVCVASMFFGGVTGSAVAEVSSIGAMMIPAMEKDGYSRSFATAIVLTAATMGRSSAFDRNDRVRACRRKCLDRCVVSRRRRSRRDDRHLS
jgi:TRAP-type C4-dicarboxylate transport system, large permease component